MNNIYAILSLKGGVAKTTTALHLAACAAASRKRPKVVVIDADEEKSAIRWASFVQETMPFEVVPAQRESLAQQALAIAKEAVVLIDTPPNNREILSRAGMVSTSAIVPVVPTGLDIDRMKPTLELLRDVEVSKRGLDVAILLTRWDGRTTLAHEAQQALKNYPVLKTKIRQLTRYAQSFGTIPNYLEEYAKAWKEIAGAN